MSSKTTKRKARLITFFFFPALSSFLSTYIFYPIGRTRHSSVEVPWSVILVSGISLIYGAFSFFLYRNLIKQTSAEEKHSVIMQSILFLAIGFFVSLPLFVYFAFSGISAYLEAY